MAIDTRNLDQMLLELRSAASIASGKPSQPAGAVGEGTDFAVALKSAIDQVGQAQRQDLLYQVRQGESGELLLREETRGQQGKHVAVRNQRVAVFGVDPFVRYECPTGGISCVLQNPADGSPLLTIVRDHKGAAELAKALSCLIRNLQKG